MTRIAILQMTSGIDLDANARQVVRAIEDASDRKAQMLFTPEMSGLLDRDRGRACDKIVPEDENSFLDAVRDGAAKNGLWTCIGSLAVKREDGRWVNRSIVIAPDGSIAARYDKIHMFDVELATGESWRESAAYAPGEQVTVVDGTPLGRLGLTICYDIRFPALFEALGRAQCDAIAIPAAFTVPTGRDHWHVLQRARAIEASAFVVAAAQVGKHEDGRETYGHSLVIDPWGKVLLDMDAEGPGLGFAELDAARIGEVRSQLPSLANKREIPN